MISRDKVVFIDRDGVINKDPEGWAKNGYVTNPGDFIFLPDVMDSLKKLTENGYKIIFISNQAGVGKGLFTEEELDKVNDYMLKEIEMNGGRIFGTFYCTHKKEDNCECRKPKSGLIRMAMSNINTDIEKTYFIGDTERDVVAAKNFGLRAIIVLSGKTKIDDIKDWANKPDEIMKDLKEAVDFIVHKGVSNE